MNGGRVEQDRADWHSYLPILRRRKWLILCPFLACLLGAGAWNFMSTSIYAATATIQVGPPSYAIVLRDVRSIALDSEVEVLKSRVLAEEVVKQLQAGGPLQRDQFVQAVNDLRGRIGVDLLRSTNILVIKVQSSVPEQAAREANALSEAYTKYTARRQTAMLSSVEEFIQGQIEQVDQKLRAAEEAMKAYRAKYHTSNPAFDASEVVLQKAIKADIEKTTTEAERKEGEEILADLRQPKPLGRHWLVFLHGRKGSALPQSVHTLAQLELARVRLMGVYTEQHSDILVLDDQIKKVKNQAVLEVEAMVNALRGRERRLAATISQYDAELKRLPAEDLDLLDLLRKSKVNEQLYDFFLKKREEARISVATEVGDARILDRALLPRVPILPNTRRRLLMGGILGLCLGLGLAFVRERLDHSVRSIEDLETRVGLPVFGSIPAIAASQAEGWRSVGGGKVFPLFTRIEHRSPAFEAYRSLRTTIQFAVPEVRTKCFLLTSPGAGEGKTVTAANLAVALARKGARILLVDADLRKPILHRIFRFPQEPGLSDLLARQVEWQDRVRPTEVENLELLPSGAIPSNPSDILESDRTKLLLQELGRHYDMVLIDSPPALPIPDAVVLSSMVDGVFLVARAGITTPEALLRSRAVLEAVNARVLGTILNAVRHEDERYSYYSYYSYSDNVEGEAGHENRWLRLTHRKLRKALPPPRRARK